VPSALTAGDYQLELFAQYAVPSDLFSNRVALVGTSLTVTGDLTGAALELGEPVHLNSANRSVWWTWTAPMDGIVTVRQAAIGPESLVFGLGSDVFTGNALASLVLVTNAVSRQRIQCRPMSRFRPRREPSTKSPPRAMLSTASSNSVFPTPSPQCSSGTHRPRMPFSKPALTCRSKFPALMSIPAT
jgi:hypothetical protein